MRIELAERMVQFPQHLADKFTPLAEWMVYGNALLRPDIREHSALIEKSSAHRKPSRRISGKSESPHLRSGEVFQQTARAPKAHRSKPRGRAAPPARESDS